MLTTVMMLSLLFFAVIAPIITLVKYYKPSEYTVLVNIFWIVFTFISWPLVPIVVATRRGDKLLMSMFYISFLFLAVSAWYWIVINVDKLLAFKHYLENKLSIIPSLPNLTNIPNVIPGIKDI